MNKKDSITAEKKLIDLITNHKEHRNGFIKCWKGLSLAHWTTTCMIAHKLINNGWKVFSEAEFKDGSRADLVAVNGSVGIVYEIMDSEKEANIDLKRLKYPKEFIIVPVRCKGFNLEEFKI